MRKRKARYIIVTTVVILVLTALLAHVIKTNPFLQGHFAIHPFRTIFAFFSLLLAVMLCSFTLYKYSPGVLTFSKTLQDWIMLAPLLAVLSLACFSVYMVAPEGFDVKWLSSSGALFVVVLAIITVGGFLLTVTRLEEIHGRILSYPHLLERIDALIDLETSRVTRKGKKNSGRLYILANAPGVGNVSAPEEFDQFWPRLRDLLSNPQVEVKIACLSWKEDIQGTSPIYRFYYEHWGGAVGEEELQPRINQSLEMISLVKKAVSEHLTNRPKELYRLKGTVHEVPFHLFLTSERAILFTALSFPDYASLNADVARKDDNREVKVIGFETGDRSILDALRKGFDRRLHKIAIRDGADRFISLPVGKAEDIQCEIPINGARTIRGLIRRAPRGNRWVMICRGLTGSFSVRSSLDELAEVLEHSGWSSLRFDYGNSLKPSADEQPRTVPSMVQDVSGAISFMSGTSGEINRVPDIVIARGFGARLALEALQEYPDVPLVLWAPILWLRTSLELRARLHELRRHGRLEFDGTEIGDQFVDSLPDPTDEQIRRWIKASRQHIIIQGEDDDVAPLRFALETKELIRQASGPVELIVVLGSHPHPATDVEIQLRRIRNVLDNFR